MKIKSLPVTLLLFAALTQVGSSQTLVQNLLWVQPDEYTISRGYAKSNWNVELFCQPLSGAIYHISNGSTSLSKLAVFVDPCWNRLMYVDNQVDLIRAFGGPGSGTNQYRAPQVVEVFAGNNNFFSPSNYEVFVLDQGNHRIQRLHYDRNNPSQGLQHVQYYVNGQVQHAIDFDYDNYGDYEQINNDLLWVATDLDYIFALSPPMGVMFGYYGSNGSGTGHFDGIAAIAAGHNPETRSNDSTIYVVDSGNQRLVKLHHNSGTIYWDKQIWYPSTSEAVDLETDSYGHVWMVTSAGFIVKFTADLEMLDEIYMPGTGDHQLNVPSCISNAGGYWGSGGMMFSEKWTETTGIKGFTIGTDIKDMFVNTYTSSICQADVYCRLTDVSDVEVTIRKAGVGLIRTLKNTFGGVPVSSGNLVSHWNGRNSQGQAVSGGQYLAVVHARSTYYNPFTEEFSAEVYDTVEFTVCSPSCTPEWKVGDADGNGLYTISDPVYLINYIFAGGPAPVPNSVGSGDADCNHVVEVSDTVYLINFIFAGGPAPQCTCVDYL